VLSVKKCCVKELNLKADKLGIWLVSADRAVP